MADEYKPKDIVKAVLEKKVPIIVRHGVIAVWSGTYRVLKKTKTGKVYRTQERRDVKNRPVTRTKTGFVDAFNIITASFSEYNIIRSRKNLSLTGYGKERNKLHIRETDNKRRQRAFERVFRKLFAKEIAEHKAIQALG